MLDFELGLAASISDQTVEADWGRAFLNPSLPQVWDASWMAIEEPGMAMGDLAALADSVFGEAGLSHRTVVACDEADGRRLGAEAGDLPGWEVEGVDYMVWRDDCGRRPNVEVREVQMGEIATLRFALIRDGFSAELAETELPKQLLEFEDRFGDAAEDRWFVAPGEEPAATCRLMANGEIGQIEDVATLTAAQNGGLAQAVTLRALEESRAAGHEVTFLAVDSEDWPRLMYEKLGFVKVGRLHGLRRAPT